VINNKKIAIISLFSILWSTNASAFTQNYTPADPNMIYQTYFDMINIGPSWSNDIKVNKEVVVAVLDSGVDLDHPDLIGSIWTNNEEIPGDGIDNDKNSYIDDYNGWDFVSSDNNPEPNIDGDYDFTAANHGTVVAGVISAMANRSGIVGIAPEAKIMPLKILDSQGTGNTLVLSQAIDYAVENGADIINLSLVGDTYGPKLEQAIINAYNKGVMIVAASGNEEDLGLSLDIDPRYPICDIDEVNRVFGVAALDKYSILTDFSNYGESCIDISAPGTEFYSTVLNDKSNSKFNKYYSGGWNGTSVAAPVISATAALIKANFPDLKPYDIYSIISASAQDLRESNPLHHIDLGAGLVDIGAALNMAANYYNNSINIVLAPQKGLKPEVLLMDTEGKLQDTFLAYGANFTGGVNLAVGDVDGDGQEEIVTAPMAGGGPHIRVFSKSGQLVSEFFAYNANFTGGVNVAVGDVDGDGQEEIVTAPMAGGGPHIKVFKKSGQLVSEFFAYEANFDGGVNVALGDVNNDKLDEIILAPMSKHSPVVRIFNYKRIQKASWLAYDASFTEGVNISVADVNNDNWPEIVTVPVKNHSPQVKMFNIRGRLKSEFLAFNSFLTSGVRVLTKDISGDSLPEILVLPSKGAASLLKIYDHNGLEKDSFNLRDPKDKNGYNIELIK
jgi:subtilisin family serine protease